MLHASDRSNEICDPKLFRMIIFFTLFWGKSMLWIYFFIRDCLHIALLRLSKFKRINFYFPWNNRKSYGFLIHLVLEAEFGDDSLSWNLSCNYFLFKHEKNGTTWYKKQVKRYSFFESLQKMGSSPKALVKTYLPSYDFS